MLGGWKEDSRVRWSFLGQNSLPTYDSLELIKNIAEVLDHRRILVIDRDPMKGCGHFSITDIVQRGSELVGNAVLVKQGFKRQNTYLREVSIYPLYMSRWYNGSIYHIVTEAQVKSGKVYAVQQ
ncbi:MAG: hypothetical protein ABIJ08_01510 [Nanoarchaeota archaeon]